MRFSRKFVDRFWLKVRKTKGCWLWQAALNKGYGVVGFEGRVILASRVSWELANGPIPLGMGVLHHCDNPPCVNPAHLYAGTQADNFRDARQRGRIHPCKGEDCGSAKLTIRDVHRIRKASAAGASWRQLAARFHVSHTAIGWVLQKKSWAHVAESKGVL